MITRFVVAAVVRCQHFSRLCCRSLPAYRSSYYFAILEWEQHFTVYFAQHPLLALLAPPVGPVFLCALLPFVASGVHFSLVYCFVGSLIPGTLFCKPSALGTQRSSLQWVLASYLEAWRASDGFSGQRLSHLDGDTSPDEEGQPKPRSTES